MYIKFFTFLLVFLSTITHSVFSHSELDFNAAQQLRLERAGRLIAISFAFAYPNYDLYGDHPDYVPK